MRVKKILKNWFFYCINKFALFLDIFHSNDKTYNKTKKNVKKQVKNRGLNRVKFFFYNGVFFTKKNII